MIRIKRKDGIEIEVETSNDPEKVERLLRRTLQPKMYARLKREVAEVEEIFFEFTGAAQEELPRLRHHLVHLDNRPRGSVNLSTGDFVITFYVHRDHLAVAEEIAKEMKSSFKNANDWQETTEREIKAEEFFKIPGVDLPDI